MIRRCAYYGDVSAIKFLLSKGEKLESLGHNYDLNVACYHGHWRLCQFLIEQGVDVNLALAEAGETPLHAALSKGTPVVSILLANGADPNRVAEPGAGTASFMRYCRTKGESPLHRAPAFGNEEDIQLLLDVRAVIDAKDANGDS